MTGVTQMARALSQAFGRPVDRRQVDMWRKRAYSNGFPECGQIQGQWDYPVDAVVAWYSTYVPPKGGRKRKDRIAA